MRCPIQNVSPAGKCGVYLDFATWITPYTSQVILRQNDLGYILFGFLVLEQSVDRIYLRIILSTPLQPRDHHTLLLTSAVLQQGRKMMSLAKWIHSIGESCTVEHVCVYIGLEDWDWGSLLVLDPSSSRRRSMYLWKHERTGEVVLCDASSMEENQKPDGGVAFWKGRRIPSGQCVVCFSCTVCNQSVRACRVAES